MPSSCHAWVGYYGEGGGRGRNKDPLAMPHVRVNNTHSLPDTYSGHMHAKHVQIQFCVLLDS